MPSPVSAEVESAAIPLSAGRGRLRASRILFNQVAFVHGNQRGTALDGGQQTVLLVVERLRGVEHNENQRRIGKRFAAACDSELLRLFQISCAPSRPSRRPAVSTSSMGMPPSEMRSVTRSRVVPGWQSQWRGRARRAG